MTLSKKSIKVAIYLIIFAITALIIVTLARRTKANGYDDNGLEVRISTYYVQEGDSYWSIAKEYFNNLNPYKDFRAYEEKIESLNKHKAIKAGDAILIQYWVRVSE